MTVADLSPSRVRSSVVFSGTLIFYSTNLLCCRATPPLPRIRMRQIRIARKSGSVFKEPSRVCTFAHRPGCRLLACRVEDETQVCGATRRKCIAFGGTVQPKKFFFLSFHQKTFSIPTFHRLFSPPTPPFSPSHR